MDRIRSKLGMDDYEEFYWFAREYPRHYRFHLDGADFRLRTIHRLMSELHSDLVQQSREKGEDCFEIGVSNPRVLRIYWDFESYLSEISVSLDLLARVIGPAFPSQTPASFRKFCKNADSYDPLHTILLKAQERWVQKLKDYRDCFIHYTPTDNRPMVILQRYADGFEMRARLPINPNVREMWGFRYNRRVELLRYAISVHKHMTALDRAIARELGRRFKRGRFPIRHENLHFVGVRSR